MSGKTILALKAACAIYQNMVNKVAAHTDENHDINWIKEKIREQGNILAQHQLSAKNRIAQNSKGLIRDGMVRVVNYIFDQTILMHGYSSVVMHVMIKAVQRGVRFNVIVTEGGLNGTGGQIIKEKLEDSNITTKLIPNTAVGIVMSKVDCIFVGCESVLENGGIMNKIGTFTVALCAKTFQKPFYVFTEALKFMKEFPLQAVRFR